MESDTDRSTFLNPFATACPASSVLSPSASMVNSSVHFDDSSSSDGDFDDAAAQPATASVVQTINIRNHIPVVLDYTTTNYSQWRCCFDLVLGKFGL
jgi:hypothetical protein